MDGQGENVVLPRFDHAVNQSVLDAENDGQLGSRVQLSAPNRGIVDLRQRGESSTRGGGAMGFGRLPHNPRRR